MNDIVVVEVLQHRNQLSDKMLYTWGLILQFANIFPYIVFAVFQNKVIVLLMAKTMVKLDQIRMR